MLITVTNSCHYVQNVDDIAVGKSKGSTDCNAVNGQPDLPCERHCHRNSNRIGTQFRITCANEEPSLIVGLQLARRARYGSVAFWLIWFTYQRALYNHVLSALALLSSVHTSPWHRVR